MEGVNRFLADFLPPGIILVNLFANAIITSITSTDFLHCHDNKDAIILHTLVLSILTGASFLYIVFCTVGWIPQPRYRLVLEAKMDMIPANLIGGFLQLCLYCYWIFAANVTCWICWGLKDVAYWQSSYLIFLGIPLGVLVYLLDKHDITFGVRTYEDIK